ncbi:MAG: hypothetical protein REI45_14220 [Propionicimonas sp.]|nr:hypothetical protein [Propionicimonas sp.]
MPELPELPTLTIDTWVAIGAIAVGLLLCFRGFAAMRWIFALIGGFAGWQLGSWAATFISFDPDFDAALRWGAVIFSAILLASLSYAFFVMGVLVGVGWLAYTSAEFVIAYFGLSGWATTWAPAVFAVVVVVAALVTKLPRLLLVVMTGVLGAAAITAAALALVESFSLLQLDMASAPGLLNYGMLWNLGFLALAAAGIAIQLRSGDKGNLRAAYA